jgi:hypothetical protein
MDAVDIFDQIAVAILPTGAVAGAGYWLKTRTKRRADKAASIAKVAKEQSESKALITRVYTLLAGEDSDPLNPNPAPGLVAKVEGNRSEIVATKEALGDLTSVVSKLADSFNSRTKSFDALTQTVVKMSTGFEERLDVFHNMVVKVNELESHLGVVSTGVSTLVMDSQTNGGSSSRDALDRIEELLGTKPPSPDENQAA